MRAGQLIAGRYRLQEHIGSGGMGVVWRAVDEKLDRMVAVKRAARPTGADSERVRRRMQREARIAAGLQHPHVVAFIDEVVESHERWLVMEYVPSQSLAQILDRFGPLHPHQVTHIGAQIASALDAVHARGIVHRDIKPGNILVTENGTAKLTDFGISRPIFGDVTLTDSGVISGTVAFLASEVADGQEPTAASDVFALGATLFAAVEGIPPFGTSDNPLLVLRRAAAGDLLPFRRAGPLAPVLSALLQPDPAQRPGAASARQLLQELATTGDEGLETWRWPIGDAARRRSRRRAVVIAGSCVVALATVAGLLVFRPGVSTPATPLAVLGDPRTADPCALTDTVALSRFGDTVRETAYGSFSRCDVIVTLSDGAQVDVEARLDKPAPLEGKVEKAEPFRVFPQPRNGDRCVRTVVLADQNRVAITAKLNRGPDSTDLCAMADAATGHAVTVLGRGAVPRRAVPADAASLAGMDACALLDSTTLTRVLGADFSNPEADFGNWKCRWTNSASKQSVLLYFDRHEPGPPATRGRTTKGKLGDRDSYLTSEDGATECDAQVVNRTDFDANGQPFEELLKIDLNGPQPADQLCGPVSELLAAAAAKLPLSR